MAFRISPATTARGVRERGAQDRSGTIRVTVELALDRPKLALLGFSEDIDAFICGGEPQPNPDLVRHLAPAPHAPELGLILRLGLEVELRYPLEGVPLLQGVVGLEQRLPEIGPVAGLL
jgi:hypothetical protein